MHTTKQAISKDPSKVHKPPVKNPSEMQWILQDCNQYHHSLTTVIKETIHFKTFSWMSFFHQNSISFSIVPSQLRKAIWSITVISKAKNFSHTTIVIKNNHKCIEFMKKVTSTKDDGSSIYIYVNDVKHLEK